MKRLQILWVLLVLPLIISILILAVCFNSIQSDIKDLLYAIIGALFGFDAAMFFYLIRPKIAVEFSNPNADHPNTFRFDIQNRGRFDAYNVEYELKIGYTLNNRSTTDTLKMHRYLLLKRRSDPENFITCAIDKQKFGVLSARFIKRYNITQNDLYCFLRISLQHGFSNYCRVYQYNFQILSNGNLQMTGARAL